MSNDWHLVTDENGKYSFIDTLIKNASSKAKIQVKMSDGTIYTMNSESDVGIGESIIMFQGDIDGKHSYIAINTAFIISVEVTE